MPLGFSPFFLLENVNLITLKHLCNLQGCSWVRKDNVYLCKRPIFSVYKLERLGFKYTNLIMNMFCCHQVLPNQMLDFLEAPVPFIVRTLLSAHMFISVS